MKSLVSAFIALFLAVQVAVAEIDWTRPESVVDAAGAVSPVLQQTTAEIRAARERVKPAGSLPNPMVMAGVQDQQIDLTIDEMMTMYMIGASQTLTRRSRREAQTRRAELEVARLESEFASERAELEREVLIAWYTAAAAESQLAATHELIAFAKQVAESARFRYEAGTAPQADLIRAMLQQSDLKHQLLTRESIRAQATERLLALLRLPIGTEVPRFSLTHGHAHPEIQAALPRETPAFAALQREIDVAEQEIRLARLALKPDIDIEASYGVRPYQKDMISVVGRIEFPYRKSTLIEPRIREAIARRDAAREEIEILRQTLQQSLGAALVRRGEAIDQIRLHEDELVPQAKSGFESALASYQAGRTTFDAVLMSLIAYQNLNIDYYDFLRQQLEAEAEIVAIREGARGGMGASAMNRSTAMSQAPAATSAMEMR